MEEQLLKDFVKWLQERPEGVFYAFDETEEAIEEFLKERNT